MIDPILNPAGALANAGAKDAFAAGQAHPEPGFEQRWSAWKAMALERLPWPFLLTIILAAVLALGEQVLEYSLELSTASPPVDFSPIRLAAFPVLAVYILANFRLMKRVAIKALARLRPVIRIDERTFDQHARQIITANPRVELILLAISVLVVVGLFVGLKVDLLNTNSSLPSSLPAAAYILVMYVLLGWLLLAVVYNSVRQALALGALARQPLVINVFEQGNLLPFGNLGLLQSLSIVGFILVPLLILGIPTKAGFLVLFLSAISFLALFVPLWGVHVQIDTAHEATLSAIHHQLQEIQESVLQEETAEAPVLASLAHRTTILINLRKTVMEAPTWPFKDSAAVARAIIAVSSPMIYFILNELIRTYLLPILSGGAAP